MKTHRDYLLMATELAEKSSKRGLSPVGAILVSENKLIDKMGASSPTEPKKNAGAIYHAELRLLLKNQDKMTGNLTLYSSLEPCLMCMGAIIVNKIDTVVWAMDDFWGGAYSIYSRSSSYIQQKLPKIIRTPYANLQRRNALLWKEHLERMKHPEYIEKIVKWQWRINE